MSTRNDDGDNEVINQLERIQSAASAIRIFLWKVPPEPISITTNWVVIAWFFQLLVLIKIVRRL